MDHRSIAGRAVLLVLVIPAACSVNTRSSDEPASRSEPSRITPEGKKAATRMLAETHDLAFADKWYMDVYPALQLQYGKPVPRSLYNLWRDRYFQDTIMRAAMDHGYNTDVFRQEFMKATE